MKQLEIQVNSLRPLQGTGRKLFVETYGCQMNVGDSEIVVSLMQREGYVYTDRIEQADVILINTCSIRDNAEQRIWGRLNELKRYRKARPGLIVGILGCMAERLRDEGEVRFMSLSAAPLAGMSGEGHEQGESAVLDHVLQMVADIMEPAYGFHSLFRFKLKFHPDEAKVYICYPDPAKLPQISLAVAQAYVPSLTPAEAMRFVRTITPHD